jgi:hypothetical protein
MTKKTDFETLLELELAWRILPVGGIIFGDDFR